MSKLILKSKTHGDKLVLFDDIDTEIISKFKWYVFKNGHGFYAMSTKNNHLKRCILMHRLILGVTDSKVDVDHKNRVGLDNRRDNLRIASRSQNQQNTTMYRHNTAGYKGVHIINRSNVSYRARIMVKGKNLHLGVYTNPKEAAIAYNNAAIKYYGEFACINQICE